MGNDLELLTDEELVDLTREGDKDAYAVLWKRYFSAGMGFASSLVRNDAEDIVVEAYTKILKAIRTGGGPKESFRPYLYSTIRNLSMTSLARMNDVVPGLEDASLGVSSVEGEMLSHADEDRIARVFSAMKPAQRKILWLSEVEECSNTELAKQMGMSKTNASTSASRARQEFVQLWIQDHVRVSGVNEKSEHAYVLSHAGEYLGGKSSDRLVQRVENHLKNCPECRDKLEEAQSISSLFRSRLAPAVAGAVTSVVLSSNRAMGAELETAMPRQVGKMFSKKIGLKGTIGGGLGLILVILLVTLPSGMVGDPPTHPVAQTPVATPPATAPVEPSPVPAPAPSPDPSPGETAAPEPVPAVEPPAAGAPEPRKPAPAKAAEPAAAAPKIVIVSVDTGPSNVCLPTVSGTALAGSAVQVAGSAVSQGGLAATVRADGSGRWSTPMLVGFSAGTRTVTALSPDGSQSSASQEFTIARQPQITAWINGDRLNLMVSNAVPGIPVDLYVDGMLTGTVVPDNDGKVLTERQYTEGEAQTVGARYHPAGCYGPVYTLKTGF